MFFDDLKQVAEQRNDEYMQKEIPDYTREDGILMCGLCNTPKQIDITIFGKCNRMPCMCKCEEERYEADREAQKKREMQHEIDRNRQNAFRGTTMASCTFAKDDGSDEKLSRLARNYANRFSKDSPWLILYGKVGSGKSYMAASIVNELLDNGFTARFTTLSIVERELWSTKNKSEVYDSLSRCDLLILDDLGVQRNTEYMNEILFNVVDDRLLSGKPMIVTTNLNPMDIMKPSDVAIDRIMSRLCEKAAPFKCEGKDRRKNAMSSNAAKIIEGLLDG